MTLLFAFFATMMRFRASMRGSCRKWQRAAGGLRQQCRNRAARSLPAGLPEQGLLVQSFPLAPSEVMARVFAIFRWRSSRIEEFIEWRGLVLSIPEAGTFAIGSDELPLAQDLVASTRQRRRPAQPNPRRRAYRRRADPHRRFDRTGNPTLARAASSSCNRPRTHHAGRRRRRLRRISAGAERVSGSWPATGVDLVT